MLRFFLNKLALIVPTLIGITICAFGFVRLLPGDPILALAGEHRKRPLAASLVRASDGKVEACRTVLGASARCP